MSRYVASFKQYPLTDQEEMAIRNYICGNIPTITLLAEALSIEGNKVNRQSAANLLANILPYWYKTGKLDLGGQGYEAIQSNN